jgi:hypothetical protein
MEFLFFVRVWVDECIFPIEIFGLLDFVFVVIDQDAEAGFELLDGLKDSE